MKQEQKHKESLERILQAAIEEFGQRGYEGASLNTLLSKNRLSKGLLYHYFKNKDQLYLACVKVCFDETARALSGIQKTGDAGDILSAYFDARSRFFLAHPDLSRIFLDALIRPPASLKKEVEALKKPLDDYNRALFSTILATLPLRVCKEDAVEAFTLMLNTFHLRFLLEMEKEGGCPILGMSRSDKTAVGILFYGIAGGEPASFFPYSGWQRPSSRRSYSENSLQSGAARHFRLAYRGYDPRPARLRPFIRRRVKRRMV